jgi:hypothetical protein
MSKMRRRIENSDGSGIRSNDSKQVFQEGRRTKSRRRRLRQCPGSRSASFPPRPPPSTSQNSIKSFTKRIGVNPTPHTSVAKECSTNTPLSLHAKVLNTFLYSDSSLSHAACSPIQPTWTRNTLSAAGLPSDLTLSRKIPSAFFIVFSSSKRYPQTMSRSSCGRAAQAASTKGRHVPLEYILTQPMSSANCRGGRFFLGIEG